MNIVDTILCSSLVLIVAIQGLYHFYFFRKLAAYRIPPPNHSSPPVSIVICAHNEAQNLEAFLPLICAQEYPEFEVIVVNDRSADHTSTVVLKYAQQYPHLHILDIKETPEGKDHKKYALEHGVEQARHSWILVTDADCYPTSDQWIKHMAGTIKDGTQLVLGYSPYQKQNTLVNKFVQIDTFLTAVQYFSYALAGYPYMGVGRNSMYKKSLFLNAKKRKEYQHITGGDDDLFMKDVANKENVSICLHDTAHMISMPPVNFKAWFRQKTRHLSVGKYYSGKIKLLLAGYQLSTLFYYIISLYLLIEINEIWWLLVLISLRTCLIFINFKNIRCTLKSFFSIKWFFMLETLYTLLIGFIGAIGVFYKRIRWK